MRPSLRAWLRLYLNLIVGVLAADSLGAAEFRGKLDPVPALGTRSGARLVEAPADLIARLPEPPPAGAQAWTLGRPFEIKGTVYALLIVEAVGARAVWIDRNRDGRFDKDESWALDAATAKAVFTLPWDNGIYREFPFEVSVSQSRAAAGEAKAGPVAPMIVYNFNVVFGAEVDVEGRPLRITFAPRPAENAINLATSRISMDTNFNGKMEPDLGEVVNPSGKSPVFRTDSRYLAVKSVDMATGVVVVEERPASDYTRFAALPGQLMPDFAFTTFDGANHRLADFRGKYVLLDFWGTWCGPCIVEMKHLDPLYEKYRGRGFEVIGMNMEKTSGGLTPEGYAADEIKVRAFLAKAGHQWLQATQRSIERVAIDVISVNAYPTCILIGPDGKVISREARGETLEQLLAKYLP